MLCAVLLLAVAAASVNGAFFQISFLVVVFSKFLFRFAHLGTFPKKKKKKSLNKKK
jgi:hypothetical protein